MSERWWRITTPDDGDWITDIWDYVPEVQAMGWPVQALIADPTWPDNAAPTEPHRPVWPMSHGGEPTQAVLVYADAAAGDLFQKVCEAVLTEDFNGGVDGMPPSEIWLSSGKEGS